jgi:hypothetical protein
MATSGTTTRTINPLEFIKRALRMTNSLGEGAQLSPEQRQDAYATFNAKLRAWQARGVMGWKVQRTSLALANGTAAYDLAQVTRDVKVEEFMLRDSSGTDVALRHLVREEYQRLPNKSTTGRPTSVLVERNVANTVGGKVYQGGVRLTFWPIPDAAYTLIYSAEQRLQDITEDTQQIDWPIEYEEQLLFDLAYDLGLEHGAVEERMQRVERRRNETADAMIKDNNERGPVRLRLNLRGYS